MNDADVSKQIQQMVRFIRQEAEEKANEISVSAEEEFNIEKLQLVELEKKKIRQEYERKEKQVDVRKKIEYSMQLNASRIKVLQAQDDLVNSMKEAASKELLNVSHHQNHHIYKKLLQDLIVQSLLRLKEPCVLLRCREDDVSLVEGVLDAAKEEYAEKAQVHSPEVIIDQIYLPSAPSHHNAPLSVFSSSCAFLLSKFFRGRNREKFSTIMLVYQDLLSGDELLSDSFPYTELENGVLWEVQGKWVVQGAVDVNIGANPSAEGADEDEGVDDQAIKVVDIVDTFRLQEQPSFDKKQFVAYMKKYIKSLTPKLGAEQEEVFKNNIQGATKYLLSKLSDLQFFVGESMADDTGMVFAYYKDGATDPTFLYLAHGLKEVKC